MLSYADIRRAIFLVVGLYLLYRLVQAVTPILFLFFAVLLLAMALNPIANRLERRRVPRAVAAGLIGLALLGTAALLFWLVIPPIVDQAQQFAHNVPAYWNAAQDRVDSLLARFPFVRARLGRGNPLSGEALGYLTAILSRAGTLTATAAQIVFSLFLALVLTIYTLATPRPLLQGFLAAVPGPYREQTRDALVRIARQVRAWVGASLLLGLIVGIVSGGGDWLLGVPNPLLLGVIAFLGEFLPNFGPVIAAVPAVLLALTVSPATALWVILLYALIQQLEAQFLAPLIMSGQLQLHPLTIAFFILVMGALAGVLGAILAVPIAAIVKVLYEVFYLEPRRPNREAIQEDADDVLAA